MKKILIIVPDFPYPLTKGGRQGVFHFIDKLRDEFQISLLFQKTIENEIGYNELKRKWDNVTFYTFEAPNPPHKQERKTITRKVKSVLYELYTLSKKREAPNEPNFEEIDLIRNNSSLYTSSHFHFSKEFIDYVIKISNSGFDIIQVEFYPFMPLIHILPPNVEKIFIHHEIRYIRNEIEISYYKKTNNLDFYTYKFAKLIEIETLKLYDKIVTVTDTDKQKLEREIKEKPIFESPLIISVPSNNNSEQYSFNNRLTFVGSSTHFPNLDGIVWFITKIWNKVLEQNKDLELHIIGSGWDSLLLQHNVYKNIYIDGYVEDLGKAIQNSISIVPIRIGSGMRMKIIDAVNWKVPFITTTVGVEGLDFIDNKDCLICDTPESFAKAINTLIKDNSMQTRFIEASYSTLQKIYNEELLLDKRRQIYNTNLAQ